MNKNNIAIYIHYPFCKSKCPYCDFNSHIEEKIDYENYENAYLKEIAFFKERIGKKCVKTIFFGGGTPSLMPISLIEAILNKISELFEIDENCEISLEANPTSFENDKFQDLRKTGINRLSLGIQALNDVDLKFLGRNHTAKESIATIENAKKIFDNFSFDLIYARPNQSVDAWIKELEFALSFDTKHLSLYQLTIEKGTKFFSDFVNKKFKMPEDEISAKFYEKTNEIMALKGFENYEISNYALPNFQCKHNLAYWQSEDYIGIGAGAHSRIYFENDKKRKAIMMLHKPQKWLETVLKNNSGIQKIDEILKKELVEEIVLMGLRLENGIDNSFFYNHIDKKISEIFNFKKLEILKKENLIEFNQDFIRISKNGKILTNSIIAKICENIVI